MLPRLLALFWLFLVPVLCADPAIDKLFVIKKTDVGGGCKSRWQAVETYLAESRALITAGLQAIEHAKDSSAKESNVAKRYLYTYFRADDAASITFVETFMNEVKNFLDGNSNKATPYLFCDDKWLQKLERTDAAWDTEKQESVFDDGPDGTLAPVAIEDVKNYRSELWEQDKKGVWIKNAKIPYWSDDLGEYVFDENYGGKTYCTESNQNLGVAQDQTVPSTITLCPSAFTNSQATANLGSKAPAVRMSIDNVLPQSGTFYHELFHLVLGSQDTPDVKLPDCYSWKITQRWLKNSPNTKPLGYDEDYQHLIRRNPESYLWFSVGYWLFLQTQWSESSNQRWSFDTGVAKLISI